MKRYLYTHTSYLVLLTSIFVSLLGNQVAHCMESNREEEIKILLDNPQANDIEIRNFLNQISEEDYDLVQNMIDNILADRNTQINVATGSIQNAGNPPLEDESNIFTRILLASAMTLVIVITVRYWDTFINTLARVTTEALQDTVALSLPQRIRMLTPEELERLTRYYFGIKSGRTP